MNEYIDLLKMGRSLERDLRITCPYLSGNMLDHIKIVSAEDNKVVICISAPFYDLKKWRQTGKIQHTGATINGKTDYAQWVNDYGGFFSGNDSQHWVNRSIEAVARAFANAWGGKMINELEL